MSYNPKWSLFNQIFQGDSKVEVLDEGTAASVVTQLDNQQIASFTGSGLKLADTSTSSRISEFSTDTKLGGDNGATPSDTVVPTEAAVREYVQVIHTGMREPTGVQSRFDTQIGIDTTGTPKFYIEPTDDFMEIWFHGQKYAYSDRQSIEISDVEGLHYYYFTESSGGELQEAFSITEDVIIRHAFVAVLYWDSDAKEVIYLGDERHGTVMDGRTHLNIHLYRGTLYVSGHALGDISADSTSATNADAQLSVTSGRIYDEDILFDHPATATPGEIPVWYKDTASAHWRKLAATDYPVTTTGSGRAAWNEFTGGAWQLTEASNNSFVLVHIFVTNDFDMPYISVCGQNEYANITDARLGATTELTSLVSEGLPFPEFVALGTVIYETSDSFGNAVKSIISKRPWRIIWTIR